jgi:hypothetical protein
MLNATVWQKQNNRLYFIVVFPNSDNKSIRHFCINLLYKDLGEKKKVGN